MRFFFVTVLSFFVVGGCGSQPSTSGKVTGTPLAWVNNQAITSSDFQFLADRTIPLGSDSLDAEQKRALVDQLIDDELLLQEAINQNIHRDPMVRRALISSLLKETVYREVAEASIDEAEAKAYFEAHQDEFIVPEKLQIRRILFRPEGDESMDDCHARALKVRGSIAKAPHTFREMARLHSKDVYAQRGGDLGYLSRDGKSGIPTEVIDTAFALEVGDMSTLFEADGGWNLVQVANRREAIERSYDQMKASVERQLRGIRQEQAVDGYLESLRKKAKLSVDEPTIDSLEWSRGKGQRPLGLSPSPSRAAGGLIVPPSAGDHGNHDHGGHDHGGQPDQK